MEFKKTLNGFAIIFSNEEFESLIKMKNNGFEENKKPVKVDPYRGMRADTKALLITLHEKYGNGWIDRKGKEVHELERKYYVRNIADVLNKLQSIGCCEMVKDPSTNQHRPRITKFRLTY